MSDEYGGYFHDDQLGDYERYVLGADAEADPDAYRERMLAAGDLKRKQEKEDGCVHDRT